jgi:DNA-binding Xre family transcriptional regulator
MLVVVGQITKGGNMTTIEQALRRAIAARKETRYATARNANVTYTTLARWLDKGSDIRLSTIEALCGYLGLELKPSK